MQDSEFKKEIAETFEVSSDTANDFVEATREEAKGQGDGSTIVEKEIVKSEMATEFKKRNERRSTLSGPSANSHIQKIHHHQ